MAHALCVLDNSGYKHTLTICCTYCFSTAKMDPRMEFNITFTCTLPVILLTVFRTVYDKHVNVILLMSRRKGQHSQRQFSLNLRPQTTVRVQFFTDPNRMKNAENTGRILINGLK
jgi:hypothetical protein